MIDDKEKNDQLVKAKTSSLKLRDTNIVSRGLSDLAFLDVEDAEIIDEEKLLQAREWFKKGFNYLKNETYDKAIEAYTNGIAFDQHYGPAYRNRGIAYA